MLCDAEGVAEAETDADTPPSERDESMLLRRCELRFSLLWWL